MVANRTKHKTLYKFDTPAISKGEKGGARPFVQRIKSNFQVDSTLIGIFHGAGKSHRGVITIVKVISQLNLWVLSI